MLSAAEPWSMPASPWTIESDGRRFESPNDELFGLRQEQPWRLALASPARDTDGSPRLHACPHLEDGGCSIRLQPGALAGLAVLSVKPQPPPGPGFQAQHAGLIGDAAGDSMLRAGGLRAGA